VPEFRYDPVSGRQVIIAPERLSRPNAISAAAWDYDDAATCPFCAGREDHTPAPLTVLTTRNEPSKSTTDPWQVRVVPNKFPALQMEPLPISDSNELLRARAVRGQQEVIIESPLHIRSLTELSIEAASAVVRTYRDRLLTAAQDGRFQAGLLFKNYGPSAGASLGHIHSQFVAFVETPTELACEAEAATRYFGAHQHCLFCAILTTETTLENRVVAANGAFVSFCPFASRLPFELCLMPRQHQSRFELLTDEECAALATFLQDNLRRLEAVIPHVTYNFWVHSAPFDSAGSDHYHWHIELLPRIAVAAGFELGSGQLINPVSPEQAAHRLRA
jgi:UDPglucose--hexose-1-phosphate uridylyltransferase